MAFCCVYLHVMAGVSGMYIVTRGTNLPLSSSSSSSCVSQGGKLDPPECSEDYGGTSPGSEKETQHIMNYWKTNGPFVGAIDWHSYGQLILHPWGKIRVCGWFL